jgi:hypothetical protein
MDPEPTPESRFVRGLSTPVVIWLMAAIYLAAHLPFLPKTPFDIDAVNFTLALHDYDLAKHQPHPPGSPLFVGLGRLTRAPMAWAFGDDSGGGGVQSADAAALAIWSACLGALALFGLFKLYAGLGQPARRAALATAVTVACPLFWFSGVRPLSDLPGLALGALSLGLLAPTLVGRPSSPRARLLGYFVAGLAPGMRV